MKRSPSGFKTPSREDPLGYHALNYSKDWDELVYLLPSSVGFEPLYPLCVDGNTALEAIIKWLLLYFLVHDKGLLFMLELY